MNFRHILVQHQYEAEDVNRLLKTGQDFSTLAKKWSTCPSAKNGGDLGDILKHKIDPDFAEAARKLQPGEISPIVRSRSGYHLILRES